MRYLALATDYDGVIAESNRPSEAALHALSRVKSSGRRVILNTGRRTADLLQCMPHLDLFDLVVTENGAVLYDPATRSETSLASPPPDEFLSRLRERRVDPLDVGRVIVATWLPHHTAVVETIQELGLELQVIFNRAAVMVLPTGVTKATGLARALRKLGLSRHEVLAVGDSENDHSLLEYSECGAAVSNAVPSILKVADVVASRPNGEGLAEIVDELIATDMNRLHGRIARHVISIGRREDGTDIVVPPYGLNLLVAGPSGTGKSTVSAGLVERLIAKGYQLCIIDPEGDYGTLPDVVTIGSQHHAVRVSEVLSLLSDPQITLNVNLLGIPLADRPAFFGELFPSLQAIRTRTGRPHWIVLDEAHHMLPVDWAHVDRALPHSLGETVLVTVHPEHLPPVVLKLVDAIIAVGPSPQKTIKLFAEAAGHKVEWPEGLAHEAGKAIAWFPRQGDPPFAMQIIPGSAERIRHHRKYAEGNMRNRSFFFRGPAGRQNIRAHNLALFVQIAEGVDDETWLYHLRRGDYSRWFRSSVKDNYLAEQAALIEQRNDLHPADSRRLICNLIESRYTLPE